MLYICRVVEPVLEGEPRDAFYVPRFNHVVNRDGSRSYFTSDMHDWIVVGEMSGFICDLLSCCAEKNVDYVQVCASQTRTTECSQCCLVCWHDAFSGGISMASSGGVIVCEGNGRPQFWTLMRYE